MLVVVSVCCSTSLHGHSASYFPGTVCERFVGEQLIVATRMKSLLSVNVSQLLYEDIETLKDGVGCLSTCWQRTDIQWLDLWWGEQTCQVHYKS